MRDLDLQSVEREGYIENGICSSCSLLSCGGSRRCPTPVKGPGDHAVLRGLRALTCFRFLLSPPQ